MNYKIPVALFFLIASVSAVTYIQPTADTATVENNISDDEDIRLYEDEEKVGYVAMWRNERVEDGVERKAIWKNMSLDRWTAMKTNHLAEEKIIERLEDRFGNNSAKRVRTNIVQGDGYHFGINVTYDRHFDQAFSPEEFKETVPDKVKGTLHYSNLTNTATLPVFKNVIGTPNDSNYSITEFNSDYTIKKRPQDEIDFDAKLLNGDITPDSPAKIQLKLEINTEENISISSGAPSPFEVIHATSGDQRVCLGSKAYNKSEHVSDNICTEGGFMNYIMLLKEYEPGVIRRNYTINHISVREPGNYTVEEDISYQPGSPDDRSRRNRGVLEYEIMFNIAER